MLKLASQFARINVSLPFKSIASKCDAPPAKIMGSHVYIPKNHTKDYVTREEIEVEVAAIFEWAKSKGAERYSFICYPHTDGVFEKHDSFLDVTQAYADNKFQEIVTQEFPASILMRNEGDGSSVPSGGLRHTHVARAYALWDLKSHLFLRRSNNTLYIPSLLVTHYGKALGEKTLFRMSEKALQNSTKILLNKIGIENQGAKMFLGLEQEFFAISEEAFNKREDLRWTNRALVGTSPARNQQLSQHYYGKIPDSVERAFASTEAECLELGIPFKTRHNEVALNQFEIACIFGETGITIDQNILLMQIMKDNFKKEGLVTLFHEKPFGDINGSGKHANWNLAYVKPDGSIKNLFKYSTKDNAKEVQTYKLFILIQLQAVLRYHKLYLSAIATPGNEIRLGGHEAPPRIFSVFLGEALANLLDGKQPPKVNNLRDLVTSLCFDVNQEDSDRNRTSPFAYTGKVFEFRALGSTQNASFPMSVVAATMTAEVNEVIKLIEGGKTVDQIIEQYTKDTVKIRFEGDGYSNAWKEEAKKRGLHVNEKFVDLYKFLDTEMDVFTKIGASTVEENVARTEIVKSNYMGEVNIEVDTLIYITRRHIIPQAYEYIKTISGSYPAGLNSFANKIIAKLETVVTGIESLENNKAHHSENLEGCQKLREQVSSVSESVSILMATIPNNPNFPDQSEFLTL